MSSAERLPGVGGGAKRLEREEAERARGEGMMRLCMSISMESMAAPGRWDSLSKPASGDLEEVGVSGLEFEKKVAKANKDLEKGCGSE